MKILLADDHRLFSEGMSTILQSLLPVASIECVFDGPSVLSQLASDQYEIVLLDLRLPGINGFDLLDKLKVKMSLVPVIVLTASDSPQDAERARRSGARGFLSKKLSGKSIVHAIEQVLQGELVFSNSSVSLGRNGRFSQEWAQQHSITPRQLEVLRLIRQGKSNQDIAEQLSISKATAKTHVSAIFTALDASNRTEAVDAAQLLGLD